MTPEESRLLVEISGKLTGVTDRLDNYFARQDAHNESCDDRHRRTARRVGRLEGISGLAATIIGGIAGWAGLKS